MAAPAFAEQDTTYMLTKTGEWNEKNRLADEYFAWRSVQVQRRRHLAAGCTTSSPGKKFYIDQDSDDDNSSISDTPDEEDSADEDSFDPLLTPTASSSFPTITKSTNSCFSVLPMTEITIVRIPNDKADPNVSSTKSHLRRCDTKCYSGLDKWFTSNSHA